jgi:hypothetical protein
MRFGNGDLKTAVSPFQSLMVRREARGRRTGGYALGQVPRDLGVSAEAIALVADRRVRYPWMASAPAFQLTMRPSESRRQMA